MTIQQVLYVLEVYRCGNLSRAAENLFISQPALSLQIRNLEKELGCAIFHRTPHGVTPTASGRAFCREAGLVERSWERLKESTKLLGDQICDHVTMQIGPLAFASGCFEKIVSFFKDHEETEVTFITDMQKNTLQMLLDRKTNVAVDRLPPEEAGADLAPFYIFPLFTEPQCVLLSPSDPRSELSHMSVDDLDGAVMISAPDDSLNAAILRIISEKHGIRFSRVHRADNMEAVMAMIRSDKGIAVGPPTFARHYGLKAVLLNPVTQVTLAVICLKENSSNPLVRMLCERLG